MANSLNIASSINGTINSQNVNQSGNNTLVPTGSYCFNETLLINTGAWQQIFTGSLNQNAGIIFVYNSTSSISSSINLAISSSGIVSNLGSVAPSNGNQPNSSLIQWNLPFTALYAQATISASYCGFIVASQ